MISFLSSCDPDATDRSYELDPSNNEMVELAALLSKQSTTAIKLQSIPSTPKATAAQAVCALIPFVWQISTLLQAQQSTGGPGSCLEKARKLVAVGFIKPP